MKLYSRLPRRHEDGEQPCGIDLQHFQQERLFAPGREFKTLATDTALNSPAVCFYRSFDVSSVKLQQEGLKGGCGGIQSHTNKRDLERDGCVSNVRCATRAASDSTHIPKI